MPELKPISREGIPAAHQKAERYRLLNQPAAAESICLDILEVDPTDQRALVTLILAITDQFTSSPAEGERRAREFLPRLKDEYKRAYYAGIICERRAEAHLRREGAGSGEIAYEYFQRALEHFERAESLRPVGNDEAILRWNTCVRTLRRHPHLFHPAEPRAYEPSLE